MPKRILTAVLLTVSVAALAVAQVRVEFRKTGDTQTLYAGGQPIGVLAPFAQADFSALDEILEIQPGLFEWTRTFTYNGRDYVRPARLVMAFEALYKSRYSLIPAVMYDGNRWGTGQEPKDFAKDGQPWVFAYHRVSIPGATYSESDKWAVGMFSKPGQIPGGFSCSLEPGPEKTVHSLIWPEEETPKLYASRDAYQDPYREDLRVSRGQSITLRAWIVVAPVTTPKHGWRTLLDTAWALDAHPTAPRFDPEDLWELGVQFAKESLWAEEKSFRGFSIGLGWDGRKWTQRSSWKYEIGWAGQNASLAASLLSDYLKTEDRTSLDLGLRCLDAWAKNARLKNGLFRCHYDYILGLEDPKSEVQDACNLGQAALGFSEAYDLAARCRVQRPEYRDIAFGICDFAVKNQNPDGRFGKAWTNDGRLVSPDGTIGAFLIPPLLSAYRINHKGAYLAAAEKAFAFYYGDFARNGFTTAGALDTDCIDKESATPLLKAALELHAITGKDSYLKSAEDVSYYLASWQWHYTVPYAPGTVLNELGYDTLGGTAVSTQHHHQDPYALIIVNDWIKLANLTGRTIWRDRALAAWANGTIGISNGDLVVLGKTRPAGSQDEGFCHTRWFYPWSVSQWLVAWPTAFRLETLRQAPVWQIFDKKR
jgi:hypothetical protein